MNNSESIRQKEIEPDWEARKAFLANILPHKIVHQGAIYLIHIRVDNPHFPRYLYGVNPRTRRSEVIELRNEPPELLDSYPPLSPPDDHQLKLLKGRRRVGESPEDHEKRMEREGRERILSAFDQVLKLLAE